MKKGLPQAQLDLGTIWNDLESSPSKSSSLRRQPSWRHFHTSEAKVFSLLTSQFVPGKNKFHKTDFHKKVAPGCNGDSHHSVGVGWDCAQTVRLVHANQVSHYGWWIDFSVPPSKSQLPWWQPLYKSISQLSFLKFPVTILKRSLLPLSLRLR